MEFSKNFVLLSDVNARGDKLGVPNWACTSPFEQLLEMGKNWVFDLRLSKRKEKNFKKDKTVTEEVI